MPKNKLRSLVCFDCKKKGCAGRCMKCGRNRCMDCLGKHNYFLCQVKRARGYPLEIYQGYSHWPRGESRA